MKVVWKRVQYLFTKRSAVRLARESFIAFGTVVALIQTASWFFIPELVTKHRVLLLKGAVAISLLFAIVRSFPRLKYNRVIRRINLEIGVKVGDLMEEFSEGRSNIVVGSNTRFTPSINRDLGQSQSIRSTIARSHFGGRWDMLDQAVLEVVAEKRLIAPAIYEVPLGSVASVKIDGKKVFFLVNQEHDGRLKNVSKENYWICLSNLWASLKDSGNRFPLAMPVLGSGAGRVAASRVSLIQLILLSFAMATREAPVTTRLTIVVQEKEYSPEEFADIAVFLDTLDF